MKLKNKEIKRVSDTLFSVGNRLGDITLRWEIALISEPYLAANSLLNNEINRLLNEQGEKDDKGNVTLPMSNPDYQALMDCESNLDANMTEISLFQNFGLNINELLELKSIIKGAD